MCDPLPPYLTQWPGKSAIDGGPEHPAVYHMLDVAAVAEQLMVHEGHGRQLCKALILLTALHDLGKIGNRFRDMLRDGKSQGRERHWQVSDGLLLFHCKLLVELLGGSTDVHHILYAATAGHHGRPPKGSISRFDHDFRSMMLRVGAAAKSDSRDVISSFANPAHAGMNRRRTKTAPPSRSVPRPRGDEPAGRPSERTPICPNIVPLAPIHPPQGTEIKSFHFLGASSSA